MKILLPIILILSIFQFLLFAKNEKPLRKQTVYNITDKPIHTLMNINNISAWISWDGMSGLNPLTDRAGVLFPRGTGNVVWADGLIWGGNLPPIPHFAPELRAGGQWYRSGMVPGPIMPDGNPLDPSHPVVRIYRIRKDWQTLANEELRLDAAELLGIDASAVKATDIENIRNQYRKDWEEWPVDWGAPYYDLNNNGLYEPALGETPGLHNADQVIWLVCNDFHTPYPIFGAPSMGLEQQITMWGYDRPNSALNNVIFRKHRLIHKSNATIDSMFVGQWADVDIGDAGNDFAGCDTVLKLGYVYNSTKNDDVFDGLNIPPSAAGYCLLESPSSSNTNLFNPPQFNRNSSPVNFSSFAYNVNWSPIGPGPSGYALTLVWYNSLNGYQDDSDIYNPKAFIIGSGPNQGLPTKFPLSGDPLTLSGDVDGWGANPPSRDRWILLSSGPFTMQPGDTQDVVFALVGGHDPNGDHLTAVQKLKENTRHIRQAYHNNFRTAGVAKINIHSSPINRYQLDLQVNLQQFPETHSAGIQFSAVKGNEPDLFLKLYDNGAHADSLANDRIWGRVAALAARKYPLNGELVLTTTAGEQRFPGYISHLTLREPPRLDNWHIVWENARQDKEINSGETVRLSFDIANPDPELDVSDFRVFGTRERNRYPEPNVPGALAANSQISDASNFIVRTGPASGDSIIIPLSLLYDQNYQPFKVVLPVNEWLPGKDQGKSIAVNTISGFPQNFKPRVADPAVLTGQQYRVEVESPHNSDSLIWHLLNIDENSYEFRDMAISKEIETGYPVVDGIEWRLFHPDPELIAIVQTANRNGPLPESEWDYVGQIYTGNSVWNSLSAPSDLNRFFMGGALPHLKLEDILLQFPAIHYHDLELIFSNTDSSLYFHLYGNDSSESVPFTARDLGIDSSEVPIQLLPVGGNIGQGFANFSANEDPYFSKPASDYLYLRKPLDSLGTYSVYEQDILGGNPTKEWINHSLEIINPITFIDYLESNTLPEAGTIIRFVSNKPVRSGDKFEITAPAPEADSVSILPTAFYLYHNYPNPFNGNTTIQFYLTQADEVKIEIFNILGQKVKTLAKGFFEIGEHRVNWDGRNKHHREVASGFYIVRAKSGKIVHHQKILLLK